jgi:hypothetical protein
VSIAAEFLQAIFQGVPAGFIELRKTGARSLFLPLPLDRAGRLELLRHEVQLRLSPEMQPFFGVAARVQPTNGRADNCGCITALIADCDFRQHGEETVVQMVAELVPEPSIIVSTGNGLHLYWLLSEPCYDLERASRLLLAFGKSIPMSDQVFDVPRVLRLPGSYNRKYTPARLTQCEVFSPELRYEIDELEMLFPAAGVGDAVSLVDSKGPLDSAIAFDEGQRHSELFRIMRSVVAKYGADWSEVWPLMQAVNQRRCSPPLPEGTLHSFLRRAYETPHAGNFKR